MKNTSRAYRQSKPRWPRAPGCWSAAGGSGTGPFATGVKNFASNLDAPGDVLNDLLQLRVGDDDRPALSMELEIARELGYRALEGFALNNLGECRLLVGEINEAAATLEEEFRIRSAAPAAIASKPSAPPR